MWHFVDLTDAEKHTRRLILNKYGFIAQLSALSIILLVALWRWLLPSAFPRSQKPAPASASALSSSITNDALEMIPQSPGERERSPGSRNLGGENGDVRAGEEAVGLIAAEGEARGSTMGVDEAVREPEREKERYISKTGKVSAWLDGSIREGWKETRRQVLCIGLWGVWLGVLVFRETGDDYFHLTKRFAQVPVSLLPFHYLLGTPARLSPLPWLFRVPASASYNAYHRLYGALMLLLLFFHAIFYVNSYIQRGLGWAPFGLRTVILGLAMVGVLAVLAAMSMEEVRRSWRAGFSWVHVLGAGGVLGLLWFHVSHARWYVIEAGVVYAAGLWNRGMKWKN